MPHKLAFLIKDYLPSSAVMPSNIFSGQILAYHPHAISTLFVWQYLQHLLAGKKKKGLQDYSTEMAILVRITGGISRNRFPYAALIKFTPHYLHMALFFRLSFSFYIYNSDSQKNSLSFINYHDMQVITTVS